MTGTLKKHSRYPSNPISRGYLRHRPYLNNILGGGSGVLREKGFSSAKSFLWIKPCTFGKISQSDQSSICSDVGRLLDYY